MRHGGGAGAVASMALTCVFGAILLLSMVTGAEVYRRVEERMERSAAERIGLTYITAKLHSADQSGGIRAGTFSGADAVFLLEELDGTPYETILYVYDGALRELFCQQDWEPTPAAGQVIAAARELRVTEAAPGFLRLRYVGGDGRVSGADVWMRSATAESRAMSENDGAQQVDGNAGGGETA